MKEIFATFVAIAVVMGKIEKVRGQTSTIDQEADLEAMESKTSREISAGHFGNNYDPIQTQNYLPPQSPQTQSFNVGYSVKFTTNGQQASPIIKTRPIKDYSSDIITGQNKEKVESPLSSSSLSSSLSSFPTSLSSSPFPSSSSLQSSLSASSSEEYVLNPFLDLKKQKLSGIKPKHIHTSRPFSSGNHNPSQLLAQANLSPKTQKYLQELEPTKEQYKTSQEISKSPWKSLGSNVEIYKSNEVPNLHSHYQTNNNQFDHQSAIGRSEGFDYTNALVAAKNIGESQHQRNTLASMGYPKATSSSTSTSTTTSTTNYDSNQDYSQYINNNDNSAIKFGTSLTGDIGNANNYKNKNKGYYGIGFQSNGQMIRLNGDKTFPPDTSLLKDVVLVDGTNPTVNVEGITKGKNVIPIRFDTRLIHSMGNQILGFASPNKHAEVFGSSSHPEITVSMKDVKNLIGGSSSSNNFNANQQYLNPIPHSQSHHHPLNQQQQHQIQDQNLYEAVYEETPIPSHHQQNSNLKNSPYKTQQGGSPSYFYEKPFFGNNNKKGVYDSSALPIRNSRHPSQAYQNYPIYAAVNNKYPNGNGKDALSQNSYKNEIYTKFDGRDNFFQYPGLAGVDGGRNGGSSSPPSSSAYRQYEQPIVSSSSNLNAYKMHGGGKGQEFDFDFDSYSPNAAATSTFISSSSGLGGNIGGNLASSSSSLPQEEYYRNAKGMEMVYDLKPPPPISRHLGQNHNYYNNALNKFN